MLQLFIYHSGLSSSILWSLCIQPFLHQFANLPFPTPQRQIFPMSVRCLSLHLLNMFPGTYAHLSLHRSLFPSRACPLVLLAWCSMEPVPHAGPLGDPAEAAVEPLIHQSPCSWQETDPRGTISAGRLEPRWLMGQEREEEDTRQVACRSLYE